jgi:4-aminobutyrate aminotransferase-like enzyme
MTGTQLPDIQTSIPGPESRAWVTRLAATECPAITARRARREGETGVPQDPIVWKEALGANVWDVDGNRYVDVTSAFAVCGIGHRHPRVIEAAHGQLDTLVHAMGDVYPSDVKIAFCERLAELAPGDLQQSILGLSGADSVVSALKTAAIHTGKPGTIAFYGGYHGLSYGALSVTGYRSSFREPFLQQLNPHVHHVPYPDPFRPPFGIPRDADHNAEAVRDACLAHIRSLLEHPAAGGEGIGAIIVEPIQGRGGEVVPPYGFLLGLRQICDEHGLVLIFDEIYTGFGRTGRMFACEWEGVVPDIMCVGKAMGGGFPISAAIGTPEVMRSWGASRGEAVHTQTFLGNPLGCAMGLAALDVLVEEDWPTRVAARGDALAERLEGLAARFPQVIGEVKGRGFMLGVDLVRDGKPDGAFALALMDACRQAGYLVLPSGVWGNVLALTPPFVITDEQLDGFMNVLESAVEKEASTR